MNMLTYSLHESFSVIPPDLVTDLRRMLSLDETLRPSALDFTGNDLVIMVNFLLDILFRFNPS